MRPKEKAKDIVDKMWLKQRPCFNSLRNEINLNDTFTNAKECALIAVDEILASKPNQVYKIYSTWIPASTYWIEVKHQIQLL